jgi:hypothetical protein
MLDERPETIKKQNPCTGTLSTCTRLTFSRETSDHCENFYCLSS